MKANDITKLTAVLYSDNVQYRNKNVLPCCWFGQLYIVMLFIVLSLIPYTLSYRV